MNKERRKQINELTGKISDLSREADEIHQQVWTALLGMLETVEAFSSEIEELKGEIESIKDEEQEYYDNMPPNMQSGDKGEAATAATDAMDRAMDALQAAMDGWAELQTAIETIRDYEVGTEVEGNCDQAISELEEASA
jgi:methyl-accepting chemotaxis protein